VSTRVRTCGAAALVAFLLSSASLAAEGEGGDPAAKGEGAEEAAAKRPPAGATGIELKELEEDYQSPVKRFTIPPYYQEKSERVTFRTLFPLFFFRERTGEGARTDLGVMPLYWRYREGASSADVYFPFYWRFRDPAFETDIVLQTYLNRSAHGFNFGFAPLFFFGRDDRKSTRYQVVPPLFWNFQRAEKGFLLAGIYYDHRDRGDWDRGVPPLFFAGRNRDKTYLLVLPPVFWRFTDEVAYETVSVVPPFFFKTRETGWSVGMLPILYFAHDKDWARVLVAPFYYGSRWGKGRSYYIPPLLTYYRKSPTLSQGGVAIFYHWYESEGDYLRMFSPLVWSWGNDRSDDRNLLVPPLFYRGSSPVSDDTMVGLVYWNFHDHHKERTFALAPLFAFNRSLYEERWRTWIAPTFDIGKKPDGYHVRLHPVFYVGKDKRSRHFVLTPLVWNFVDEEDKRTVVFPLWWSFEDLEHRQVDRVVFPVWWQFDDLKRSDYKRAVFPFVWDMHDAKNKERTTVVVPLFWRDRDPRSTMTGVFNVVWHKGAIQGNPFWTFQLFPLIALGHPPAPEAAYWSFLGGLAGWRRQGSTKELKILWIPFDVSDDEDEP